MRIDKDLLDQLMKGRKPGDLFGKEDIRQEWTKALVERAFRTELDVHLTKERADPPTQGGDQLPDRRNGTRHHIYLDACTGMSRLLLKL